MVGRSFDELGEHLAGFILFVKRSFESPRRIRYTELLAQIRGLP